MHDDACMYLCIYIYVCVYIIYIYHFGSSLFVLKETGLLASGKKLKFIAAVMPNSDRRNSNDDVPPPPFGYYRKWFCVLCEQNPSHWNVRKPTLEIIRQHLESAAHGWSWERIYANPDVLRFEDWKIEQEIPNTPTVPVHHHDDDSDDDGGPNGRKRMRKEYEREKRRVRKMLSDEARCFCSP